MIEDLRRNGKRGRWKSFRQALDSILKQEETNQLLQRMDRLREQVVMNLVITMRYVSMF